MARDLSYRSVEEKLELGEFTRGVYGGIVGFFRLPTTIRKTIQGQSLLHKMQDSNGKNSLLASGIGLGFGTCTDVLVASQFLLSEELFYTWLATNIASGIYEGVQIAKRFNR